MRLREVCDGSSDALRLVDLARLQVPLGDHEERGEGIRGGLAELLDQSRMIQDHVELAPGRIELLGPRSRASRASSARRCDRGRASGSYPARPRHRTKSPASWIASASSRRTSISSGSIAWASSLASEFEPARARWPARPGTPVRGRPGSSGRTPVRSSRVSKCPEVVGEARGLPQLRPDKGAGPIDFGLVGRPLQRLVAEPEGFRIPIEGDQAAGELPEKHGVIGSPLEAPLQVAGRLRRSGPGRSTCPPRDSAPSRSRDGGPAIRA